MSPLLRRCALAAILVTLAPAASAAQDARNRPAVSISGGARVYERADFQAHTAVSVAIRSELPLAQTFVLELGGSVADVPEGTPSGAANLFESQLQLALPLGEVLTPYAGAGIGAAKIEGFGREPEWQAIFSAGLGVRAMVFSNVGVVADARIRGRGSQLASHMDVTLGLRYAFGRPDRPRFRGGRT